MRKIFFLFLFILPVFLFAAEKFETTPGDPFGFHRIKLENGLTVILAKNTDQPKIQSYILVHAGSLDDPERSTGLAHYFEHMMFKGSSRIAALNWEKEKPLLDRIEALFEQYRNEKDPAKRKAIYAEIDKTSFEAAQYSNDEYWEILRAMGCTDINAFTSYEVTAYETVVPSHMLETFLTLEQERFSNIAMRRFHTELETVYEEFNRTQDNDRRQAISAALKLVAGEKHPFARPVIGLPEHLKNPSIRDVKNFFHQYYVPENMVLILVGDLDYEKTIALVRKTFGTLPAKKVAAKNPVSPLKPLSKPLTTEVTGPESEFLIMAIPMQVDRKENGYIRDLIFTVLSNGKNGIFDTNLRKTQKVQQISCSLFSIADEDMLFISAQPLQGQSLEELRALIESELDNLKNGNFDPAILTAAVNNDRFELMTMAESRSSTASVALNLVWHKISMQEILDDLKKTEQLTKEEFVRQTNRILNSAPAIVYKRSGEKKDRVHAEKPPITPLKMPESRLSAFGKELAALPAGKASDLQVIDWSTAITETPVSGTKLYCTKNEKNERFSFSIVLPIGSYHDLKHDLAISYLSLLGTETKDLTTFNSELYNLALDMDFEVDEYTTTLTITGLQKYLPQALRLLTERLTLAKADPAAYTRFVERIKKARADARQEPGNYLFAARTFAVYGGKNNPLFHVLSPKELEAIKPEELTAHLRALLASMPREFVYYGPASPDEVASLIQTTLPAPAEKQIVIPEPVKFKIQPPQEHLVYLIRHPSAQVIACLTRTDTIRIPADTAAARIIDEYTNPLYFQELREKQSLGYVAQAAYAVPGIHPDNYSQFIAILGTQPDKLRIGMQSMRNMTNELPQNQLFFNTIQFNTLTALQTMRIKPEYLYWYRRNMAHLKRPLDQTAKDHARIKAMTSTQFYALAKEAMNRSKDLWVLSGNVTEPPEGFGKVIILTPNDILPE